MLKREARPRVLIASDEPSFVPPLAEAYAQTGFDVAVGAFNFFLQKGEYDVIQYCWPEEYSSWRSPNEVILDRITMSLAYWKEHAWPVSIMNNFYPHGYEGDRNFKSLYDAFFRYSNNVVQYSRTCNDLCISEFPSAVRAQSTISNYCAYHELRRGVISRDKARADLGIASDEFVVLVFGALRFWDEVKLLMAAYSQARIAKKRLLKLSWYRDRKPGSWIRQNFRELKWKAWLRKSAAIEVEYVPNEELERYFAAADVVPVLRIRDMYSGAVGMAMTFGKLIVAPDYGSYPELLVGTDNLIYKAGCASSLRAALEKASRMDLGRVQETNLSVASSWTWRSIVGACLTGSKFSSLALSRKEERCGTRNSDVLGVSLSSS